MQSIARSNSSGSVRDVVTSMLLPRYPKANGSKGIPNIAMKYLLHSSHARKRNTGEVRNLMRVESSRCREKGKDV